MLAPWVKSSPGACRLPRKYSKCGESDAEQDFDTRLGDPASIAERALQRRIVDNYDSLHREIIAGQQRGVGRTLEEKTVQHAVNRHVAGRIEREIKEIVYQRRQRRGKTPIRVGIATDILRGADIAQVIQTEYAIAMQDQQTADRIAATVVVEGEKILEQAAAEIRRGV